MGTMTSMATEMTKSLFYQASWGLTRKFAGQCGSVRVSKKKINEINAEEGVAIDAEKRGSVRVSSQKLNKIKMLERILICGEGRAFYQLTLVKLDKRPCLPAVGGAGGRCFARLMGRKRGSLSVTSSSPQTHKLGDMLYGK